MDHRSDMTVATPGDLVTLYVSELRDGCSVWVTSEQAYFTLSKQSSLTVDNVNVYAPLAGSPIAGAAGAKWFRSTGSNIVGDTNITVTSADVTLTAQQAQASGINTSGVLTANRNIILPTVAGMVWDVYNNNTGGLGAPFTTTFKTLNGTGIAPAQGMRCRIRCDGTNIVRVTPDV